MKFLWRFLLITTAACLAWLVLIKGVAELPASQHGIVEPQLNKLANGWSVASPNVLVSRSLTISEAEPDRAIEMLRRAIALDPTNAQALVRLAALLDKSPDAERLARLSVELAPTDPEILKLAGVFWFGQGEVAQGMAAFSRALSADPVQGRQIYPAFLKLLEEPTGLEVMAPFTKDPPEWWEHFFTYVAHEAADVETLRTLYAFRKSASPDPISASERQAYVERLRKARRLTEAYLTWVNGLAPSHREVLGLLNNGSFEVDPDSGGYDWQFRDSPNLTVELAATYGVRGDRALHLAFLGFDEPFYHIRQELFLDPGVYELSGEARPDGLKTTGGLQWRIYCLDQQSTRQIANTTTISGTGQWQPFSLVFEIPTDCERPMLRLVSIDRNPSDRRIDGSVWFDAMAIRRTVIPDTAEALPDPDM